MEGIHKFWERIIIKQILHGLTSIPEYKKKKKNETFETLKNYCFPLPLLQMLDNQCYASIRYIHVSKDRKSHMTSGFNGLVNLHLPLNEDQEHLPLTPSDCCFSSVVILNLACHTLTQAAQKRFTGPSPQQVKRPEFTVYIPQSLQHKLISTPQDTEEDASRTNVN